MKVQVLFFFEISLLFISKFIKKNKIFKINGKSIVLPMDHLLPFYKKNFRKYDEFIVKISETLPQASVIVDVGSNVGDTLASIYREDKGFKIYCIEADEKYYDYLVHNIKSNDLLGVEVSKDYVGIPNSSFSLIKHGSSKRSTAGSDVLAKKISDIFPGIFDNINNYSLIKVDTDGSDYNVILGSEDLVKKHPQIFFEAQIFDRSGLDGYYRALSLIEKVGGYKFVVFDNFGELLCKTDQVNILQDLLSYLLAIAEGRAQRTVYYFDIYAYHEKISYVIDPVVDEYCKI